jgi:hypothetical protein
MNVTLREAIAIYARASIAWFGERAIEETDARIRVLSLKGDNEGVGVLERVKGEIRQLQRSHRRRKKEVPRTT